MSFEGMDVEQLQGLAKQIDSDAQALDKLVITLTGVVGTLTLLWNGPMAATFEQDWQSKNRPALLAAYDILTTLHTHLVNNISQQTSASAAEGGWTAGRVINDLATNGPTAVGAVGFGLSVISELGERKITPLTKANLWEKGWTYATEDRLFRLPSVNVGWIKTTAKFVADHPVLDDGLKVVGIAGSAVKAFDAVDDLYDAGDDLYHGHYAAATYEAVEGAANGLQAYPSPVTELAGVGLKLADQVAKQELQGTPAPVSGSNFPQNYVPSLSATFTTRAGAEQAVKVLWADS
jgi:uncharacterized protein YukE